MSTDEPIAISRQSAEMLRVRYAGFHDAKISRLRFQEPPWSCALFVQSCLAPIELRQWEYVEFRCPHVRHFFWEHRFLGSIETGEITFLVTPDLTYLVACDDADQVRSPADLFTRKDIWMILGGKELTYSVHSLSAIDLKLEG